MIRLENVFLTLGDSPILKDISFSIEKDETGVMLGASGSGKTTILRVILGLYRPDSGHVYINGDDITGLGEEELYKAREKMGMVFQGGALFDSLTVGENVGYRLRESGVDEEDVEARVRKSLCFVGLEDSIDNMPAELSGGMKKRVAIARGIAAGPRILLYDEPTSGLDPVNAHNVTMLINRLREEEGVASVVVTHDIQAAFCVATKIAFIDEGNLVYVGDRDGLLASGDDRVRAFLNHSGFMSGSQAGGCSP